MPQQRDAAEANLVALAASLSAPDTSGPDGVAGSPGVAAMHAQARASLIAKVAALPPKATFSPSALQAFRGQHVAMMSYVESHKAQQHNLPS